MLPVVLTEWPGRGPVTWLSWVSLRGSIASAMTKNRSMHGIQLQSSTGPKDSPEALMHVLSLLLIQYLLPNTAVPPHISPFIMNPLPESIAVAILIFMWKESEHSLIRKVHALWSQWGGIFMGPTLYSTNGHVAWTSIMSVKFGRLVLDLQFGIKLLGMPHMPSLHPKAVEHL